MPQLDIVSYFSQYVWLMVFYIGFYFILVNSLLPKVSRILKVRSLKIQSLRNKLASSDSIGENGVDFKKTREENSIVRLRFAQQSLVKAFSNVSSWIVKNAQTIQKQEKVTSAFKNQIKKDLINHIRVNNNIETLTDFADRNKDVSKLNSFSKEKKVEHIFYSKKLFKC
jgi:hypothetical protein